MIDERDNIGLQFLNGIYQILFNFIPTLLGGFFQLLVELFYRIKDTLFPIIQETIKLAFKTIFKFFSIKYQY